MIGSFLTRGLVMVFGYAYPAYECFKTLEDKHDIQLLSFWCQYWIIVATMTVCERIADSFISWVPMYSEAKLAFYIYLWFPKTKGTTYVYESFFKPLVKEHQHEIDRNLEELKTKAGDTALSYWQKAAGYIQKRVFEILQYIALQSTSTSPSAPGLKKTAKEAQTEEQQPTSPPSESSSENEDGGVAKKVKKPTPSALNAQKTTPTKIITETLSKASTISSEAQQMQVVTVHSSSSSSSSSDDKTSTKNPATESVVVEEPVGRITRARSRKNRAAP